MAAQDQAISTNYFKNNVLKEETESKCQLCKQHEETIDHLTSGCPILAKNEYFMRHDEVRAHLHYSICKALGIETTYKWYTHMPKPLCEDGDVTVLWNQAVHTDREVRANKPGIIIKNKIEETCTLIDVAIPADRNAVKRKRKSNNNWSNRNSNEKLKEKFGNCTRKTLDRVTTKDSYTWNITHNTESIAV